MNNNDLTTLSPSEREALIAKMQDEVSALRQQALHIIIGEALAQAAGANLDAEDLMDGLNQYLDEDVLYVRQRDGKPLYAKAASQQKRKPGRPRKVKI